VKQTYLGGDLSSLDGTEEIQRQSKKNRRKQTNQPQFTRQSNRTPVLTILRVFLVIPQILSSGGCLNLFRNIGIETAIFFGMLQGSRALT
jgi:hypothetical protein